MAEPPAAKTESFLERLRAALVGEPALDRAKSRGVVALSGGLDSTVLLHALTRLDLPGSLVALHVDHGIHADSAIWATRCAELAAALGVPFAQRRVEVRKRRGESLEAAARELRYRAFAEFLGPDDVLLTAHHGNDQLETVLLRIVRGTGVRGLTAIHASGTLGAARFLRPLLERSRAEIEAYARASGLTWLEDPSNRDLAFDRNYLRAEVVPALEARWPAAPRLATRLARQMAEAEGLLADLAGSDLARVDALDCLPLELLRGLAPERQSNVLRHALRSLGLPLPDARQIEAIKSSLDARSDAEVCVSWPGAEARVYRSCLYLMAPLPVPGPDSGAMLKPEDPWAGWVGRIELAAVDGYGIPDAWAREGLTVRFRAGGERILPRGAAHHKTLKHWFQETGIVPWMRARVPLVYHADRLVAVGETLVGDLPAPAAGRAGWTPRWTGHPRLR